MKRGLFIGKLVSLLVDDENPEAYLIGTVKSFYNKEESLKWQYLTFELLNKIVKYLSKVDAKNKSSKLMDTFKRNSNRVSGKIHIRTPFGGHFLLVLLYDTETIFLPPSEEVVRRYNHFSVAFKAYIFKIRDKKVSLHSTAIFPEIKFTTPPVLDLIQHSQTNCFILSDSSGINYGR